MLSTTFFYQTLVYTGDIPLMINSIFSTSLLWFPVWKSMSNWSVIFETSIAKHFKFFIILMFTKPSLESTVHIGPFLSSEPTLHRTCCPGYILGNNRVDSRVVQKSFKISYLNLHLIWESQVMPSGFHHYSWNQLPLSR